MRIRKVIPTLALAGTMTAGMLFVTKDASAQLYGYGDPYQNDSLDAGDVLGAFFTAALNHFGSNEQAVYSIYDLGITEREIPVVLYLSRQTGISPLEIANLRASGYSWSDITYRLGLTSEIFYVPLSSASYGSYASYYNMPRTRWSTLRLDDSALIDLVNVRFVSDYYRTSPDRIVQLRRSGQDFTQIARQFHRPERNGQIRPWTHRRQVNATEARRQIRRNDERVNTRREVPVQRRDVIEQRRNVTEQRRVVREPVQRRQPVQIEQRVQRRERVQIDQPVQRRERVQVQQPMQRRQQADQPRNQNRAARAQQNQVRREARAEQRQARKAERRAQRNADRD